MLVCPSCARVFEDGQSLCPVDGVFLRAPDDPRTGQTVGNYRFMGRLGRGGMGTVYRGEHVIIGKPVALKVLHRELTRNHQGMQRFLAEARAASMIRHPNIVDVTDFGTAPDGSPFFVMEFLEGPDLEREITGLGQLPIYRAVNILRQVCRALHACHGKGIVHRDLKPENILLLRREGHRDLVTLPSDLAADPVVRREGFWDDVKILDFGVARIHHVTTALDRETQKRGIVFGSPYYVSPEQALGQPGDFRSDLYSLGVILFEMLTGQVPFDGETPTEVMTMHTRAPVPSLREVRPDLNLPPEAERLVLHAMSKRPQDRPRSAMHFLELLSQCFGDVIYGRDIDRYLALRRRRAEELQATPLAPSAPSTVDQAKVEQELGSLFQGKYEAPKPITQTTHARIERRRSSAEPEPDPAAVREELAGLFHRDEE